MGKLQHSKASFIDELFEKQDSEKLRDLITEKGSLVYRSYRGRAADHLVVSELLWRGYNASIMAVDEGIDVFATKRGRLYAIQVKTVKEYRGKTFPFLFRTRNFTKRYTQNTFYFLVVPSEDGHFDFLILPLQWIRRQIRLMRLREDQKTKSYVMVVVRRNSELYLNNRRTSLRKYTNNWSLLR